jgi:xyloglucan fucosyltransferase
LDLIAETSTPEVMIQSSFVLTFASKRSAGPDDFSFPYTSTRTVHDRLHGGLLAAGFDQEACHSRYQSAMYRRNPGRRPSEHLVSKLRRHEALQRRCGPGTAAYSSALEQLKSGKNAGASPADPDCRYLVSISYRGLGNRILAAASAFLYALLTDRVLLVDSSNEMGELFCEPFPDTTWLLPWRSFPLWNFSFDTQERYGRMRENGVPLRTNDDVGSSSPAEVVPPAFAYIHLDYNHTAYDQLFFCDDDQRLLSSFQWLVMRTDSYIAPGLFLVESFQEELDMLFPEREAVFHHLGRYLFHPTNHVWGLITRYYRANLAWAQRRVGIQVRVFPWEPDSPELLERITKCTQEEGMLPGLVETEEPAAATTTASGAKSSAVLITSLKAWYYEQMKGVYWENATANGEVVVVNQPSHEEYQHYGVKSHEYKAWAEIYLLSLTDMLVTTGKSTFGYVAQGLAGLRPWVLLKQANGTAGHGWCSRDMSLEPCFHVAPSYDCKRRHDSGEIVPHVRHCEDVPTGLKLVDPN